MADMIHFSAPAKINLYLHVTGKRDDGYHALDFLSAFADFGDSITIEPAEAFTFAMNGAFAGTVARTCAAPDDNLVVRAAHALAGMTGRTTDFKLTLTKNIPVGAGLGGGSADAAATVKALLKFWNIKAPPKKEMDAFLLSLGADVPACYHGKPAFVSGIGDVIEPAPKLPDLYAVLVYPNKPCATPDVFRLFEGDFRKPVARPEGFSGMEDFCAFLKAQDNDLTAAAARIVPDIRDILHSMDRQQGHILTRMSGSGSCCFALFDGLKAAQNTAFVLRLQYPDWWVKSCTLNYSGRKL